MKPVHVHEVKGLLQATVHVSIRGTIEQTVELTPGLTKQQLLDGLQKGTYHVDFDESGIIDANTKKHVTKCLSQIRTTEYLNPRVE